MNKEKLQKILGLINFKCVSLQEERIISPKADYEIDKEIKNYQEIGNDLVEFFNNNI